MDKASILFFHPFWLTGGVERVTASIANGLCADYDVHILVHGAIASRRFSLDGAIHFTSLEDDADWLEKTLLYVREHGIRLVIGSSGLVPSIHELYRALYAAKVPYVVCNHESYFYPVAYRNVGFGVPRMDSCEKAAAATFPTSFSVRCYGCSLPNGAFMPNPCPFPASADYLRDTPQKTVVAVGRWYDANKRLDRVLRTFHLVLDEEPAAQLLVVGKTDFDAIVPAGQGRSIRQYLQELAIPEEAIIFAGEDDVRPYYQQADVSLLTSESEGFGMVLIEAAAYGVPSILCRIPGLEDIVKDGKTGFIVEQDDVVAMAERVLRLFRQPDMYRNMRKAALQAAETYDGAVVAKRWAALIETVLYSDAPDLAKFQPSLHFSDEESAYMTRQLQSGLAQSVHAYAGMERMHHSWPFRLALVVYKIKNKVRKILKLEEHK